MRLVLKESSRVHHWGKAGNIPTSRNSGERGLVKVVCQTLSSGACVFGQTVHDFLTQLKHVEAC